MMVFTVNAVIAQTSIEIQGFVADAGDAEPLTGANISFRLVKDTTVNYFTSTDAAGYFSVKVGEDGFYRMNISFIGYEPFSRILRITSPSYELPPVRLQPSSELLQEVKVSDKPIVVMQQGDTTAFLADGFKTNPDATAGDLLRKLPGVVVDGSGVQAQGENVQRVLVDGREFFGNDPMATLKNLPAEVIERIEVFDQLSDQAQFSGYDDGNTVKTINIVTRPETRNGTFGRAYAGIGTDEHYSMGGNINFFNEAQRLSVVGLSNDINVQNFSSEDLVGVASSATSGRGRGGRSGGRGGGGFSRGSTDNFLTANQNGISDAHALGINYVDDFLDEDLKISASAFVNRTDNINDQVSHREYFLNADSSYFYDDRTSQDNLNDTYRFNARIQYAIDDRNMLIVTPALRIQNNSASMLNELSTSSLDGDLISSSLNKQDNEVDGMNFSNNLVYRYAFSKRGRTLSFRLRNTLQENEGLIGLSAANTYFSTSERTDTLKQETETFSLQRSIDANITYTEPLGERMQLQLTQSAGRNTNATDNKNYDLRQEDRPLNPKLSNEFESVYINYNTSAGISVRMDKGFLRAGMAYQYGRLENEIMFPVEDDLYRVYNNILPSLFGRINFSREKNLRLVYRTSTDIPSVTQLQNLVDNSNPLLLTGGNPELDQSYSHRLMLRYSSSSQESASGFFAFISAHHSQDYISNETFIAEGEDLDLGVLILPAGSQFTRPVNLNGYWNLRSLVNYSIPSTWLKSVLNFTAGVTYVQTPGVINRQSNISRNAGVSLGVVVASNISENIDFNVGYTGNFNLVENSLQPELSDTYVNSTFNGNINWIFGKGWVFRTDLNYQRYDGLSDGFNQNFIIWNASIGRKFMERDRAEISIRVFDLLGQNQSINRTISESFIEDASSVVLQQYVMINFLYTIRNFKE